MKIENYEVILDSNGKTVNVNTIDMFDKERTIIDDGNKVGKKIKTKANQVKNAATDFMKSLAMNKPTETVQEAVVEDMPFEKEKNVEKEAYQKPVAPVVEPTIERNPEPARKYSFETVPTAEAINNAYKTETKVDYEAFYSKLDSLEKLKQEFANCKQGTFEHKVLELGIKKVEKYDELLAKNDMKQVELEQKQKEIQMEIEKNKTERLSIEKKKKDDALEVSNAAKNAKQIDDLDAKNKEAQIKREQEEAQRKAQKEAEDRAMVAKRAEMLSRIPLELQEEPAKTPVAIIKQEPKNTDTFDKFRKLEEETEVYNFGGRRTAA